MIGKDKAGLYTNCALKKMYRIMNDPDENAVLLLWPLRGGGNDLKWSCLPDQFQQGLDTGIAAGRVPEE